MYNHSNAPSASKVEKYWFWRQISKGSITELTKLLNKCFNIVFVMAIDKSSNTCTTEAYLLT